MGFSCIVPFTLINQHDESEDSEKSERTGTMCIRLPPIAEFGRE